MAAPMAYDHQCYYMYFSNDNTRILHVCDSLLGIYYMYIAVGVGMCICKYWASFGQVGICKYWASFVVNLLVVGMLSNATTSRRLLAKKWGQNYARTLSSPTTCKTGDSEVRFLCVGGSQGSVSTGTYS